MLSIDSIVEAIDTAESLGGRIHPNLMGSRILSLKFGGKPSKLVLSGH